MSPAAALRAIRLLHSAVRVSFAGCIVAIPLVVWQRDFGIALALIAIVMVEAAVLAVNGFRCALTDVAARYTDDRRENFDIYLPRPSQAPAYARGAHPA